jgi:hypothetical protein
MTNAVPQGNAARGPAVNDKPDISHQQKDGCNSRQPACGDCSTR